MDKKKAEQKTAAGKKKNTSQPLIFTHIFPFIWATAPAKLEGNEC